MTNVADSDRSDTKNAMVPATGDGVSVSDASDGDGPFPEFSIVVKHPTGRGPIGPYRLVLAVVVAAIVLGPAIYSMLLGRSPDDVVVLRAAGIGLLVWVTTGIVDSALAAADNDDD
ncbi:MAG: hypothetical protein AB8G26_12945 [Ilumatobacter sp.]